MQNKDQSSSFFYRPMFCTILGYLTWLIAIPSWFVAISSIIMVTNYFYNFYLNPQALSGEFNIITLIAYTLWCAIWVVMAIAMTALGNGFLKMKKWLPMLVYIFTAIAGFMVIYWSSSVFSAPWEESIKSTAIFMIFIFFINASMAGLAYFNRKYFIY